MYRKLSTKHLVIIFVILAVLVALVELKDKLHGERSFRAQVVTVDTSKITGLVISTVKPAQLVNLSLDDSTWVINQNGHRYIADQRIVHNILWRLVNLKPEWLAATDKEQWSDLQVSDSLAVKVDITEKDSKKQKILFLGKISYQAPQSPYGQGTMSSYIRLGGENKVYAVQGFLRMDFPANSDAYRLKDLIGHNPTDWTKLTFTYPADSSFDLIKQKGHWFIHNKQTDSVRTLSYLEDLAKLKGTHFADTLQGNGQPILTLTIEGNNMQPIVLNAYPSVNTSDYLLHSSFNNQAWFIEDKNTLPFRLFKPKSYFLKPAGTKK